MAVPRKQRRIAPRESSDSDDGSDHENNQEMETIEVDFDVKFPESTDRHGIKNLLQQLFLKAHINTSELADILIEQNNITGVVKQAADESDEMDMDDDMDVNFGVFSVLNITEKRNVECIKQIHSYLLNHCKEVSPKSQYEMFQNILEDSSKHVGLIISERFINIPAKISVPLYMGLSNDICKAREKKEAYDFAYYLLICKIGTFTSGSNQESIVYLNPEEELIAEEAEIMFEFEIQKEQESGLSENWTDDDDDEGIPKRKVLLIPACKWDTICNKLSAEFGRDLQQHAT